MFLGYQNEKIVLTANTREELESTPCIKFDEIVESDVEYTLYDGEYLTQAEVEVKEKQAQKANLLSQLDTLDLKCIRSIRAIQSGNGTTEDETKLAEYEELAKQIRQQIKELGE